MANRPLRLIDYIGQDRIKTQLKITMGACRKNSTNLPHILLSGNPGLGKTTLAKIIAEEFGVGFHEAMGSSLRGVDEIVDILAPLSNDTPDILFIDEIHRMPLQVEELLYPVMEDNVLEVDSGTGLERFWVPKFTLIGATTLAGELSRPLRDRFGLKFQLQNYQLDEIVAIIANLAGREDVRVDREALYHIARRAKGVARIAINYFYRCKEYADYVADNGIVTSEVAEQQFAVMGIDDLGLDENDYRVLEYLSTQSRPVGIAGLSTGCDIDQPTITNIIEPYLVQVGMINRTRSGREITERGLRWLSGDNAPQPEVSLRPSNSINDSGLQRVGTRARR